MGKQFIKFVFHEKKEIFNQNLFYEIIRVLNYFLKCPNWKKGPIELFRWFKKKKDLENSNTLVPDVEIDSGVASLLFCLKSLPLLGKINKFSQFKLSVHVSFTFVYKEEEK